MSRNHQIRITVALLLTLAVAVMALYMYATKQRHDNVQPQVVSTHEFHHPTEFVASLKNDAHAGEKVYHAFCENCHATEAVIPMGAPRIANKSDWQMRSKKGVDQLVQLTANGIGNMPARGGCFECSDELLRQAIIYMLPKA